MSAIVGILSLDGISPVAPEAVQAMAAAVSHRGPDEQGIHLEPRFGMAWNKVITSPASPRCVATTESGDILAHCQGQIYNADELRQHLAGLGHQPRTNNAAEVAAHAWQAYGPGMLERLCGPFGLAIWDRPRGGLVLACDRFGVTPFYWARRGPWFLFGSEIKAILASGLIRAEADLYGLDHAFTFMGMPGTRTCFKGVQALLAGHYLSVAAETNAEPRVERYWDLDFPDAGQEESLPSIEQGADHLQELLSQAVARRMAPDEAVASYISGGIDCSTVVALAGRVRQQLLPTFSVRLEMPDLDESDRAARVAEACGTKTEILSCSAATMQQAYPRLIQACEQPVTDASSATLLLLAERVRQSGHRVVLAGDGADDLFAGYPWFRIDRMLRTLDFGPFQPSMWLRRLVTRINAPHFSWARVKRLHAMVGGHNPWLDVYGIVGMLRHSFYSEATRSALGGRLAYEDLSFPLEKMRRWSRLNRGLYFGMKMHVAGLLLKTKGDRLAQQSGVEIRFPYLDEDVVAFATRLAPRWKLHGLRDKYLLRHVAARWLPKDIAWRPKRDFLAPADCLYSAGAPAFVNQLLSEESLRATSYFDPAVVTRWRREYEGLRRLGGKRIAVEMGLAAVAATQLWHHTFIKAELADLPGWQLPQVRTPASSAPANCAAAPVAANLSSEPRIRVGET